MKHPEDTKDNSAPIASLPKEPSHGLGKAVFIAIVIFIILIASGGGYYFWMTRISIVPDQIILPAPEDTTEPPAEETIPSLSSQNSNYLSLNFSEADAEKTKAVLVDYSNKVLETNLTEAFEFIITDEMNNPVSFQDFSDKLGLNISDSLLLNLNSDFSFYIHNYGDKTRFAIAVSSKNDALLKTALLKEEKSLFKSLYPLYPAILSAPQENQAFQQSTYNNYPLRYLNITEPEDFSIDYAVVNNKLVLATTRTALFSILDRIIAENKLDSDIVE